MSLSACVINVLRVAIYFISLQASTGELWSNQFDIARQVDLYFCDGLYVCMHVYICSEQHQKIEGGKRKQVHNKTVANQQKRAKQCSAGQMMNHVFKTFWIL